jgi:hypothetical protein
MSDNIPLLAELKCGKINCEQHTLSETLHDRPGTTIPKPPNPRDNRNCYFFLKLFLNLYLCILILSEQKLDRDYHCRSQPQAMHKVAIAGRINATLCSHQLFVISLVNTLMILRYSFNNLRRFISIAQQRKIAETILDSTFRHSTN